MSSVDYFSRVNRDLLALIPPDAKVVLEIGCGAGALCEAYRRINPGVRWRGIEINDEAAKLAADKGIKVLVYDANYDLMACWLDANDVDVLIFGDVLEHLPDPWAALKRFARYTRPGSQVLASIPNMQHFSAIYHLLIGEWPQANEGLFDRTHLRWFTLKSIREMFDGAGLQVLEVRGIRASNDEAGWKEWLKIADKIEVNGFELKQTAPLQYLVRAVKPPAEITPLHIHAVTAEGCCARPRILEPFAMLATIPGVKCTAHQFQPAEHDSQKPDIVIQQRFRSIGWTWQQAATSNGTILIAELDDHPGYLEGMSDENYAPLRAVHAVQVSTEKLAEVVRQYNPNVMVFENQIADLPAFDRPKTLPNDDTIRIFYGAQNRQADWKPIMPALLKVLAEFPNVSVHVVHDREFFDALVDYRTNKEFHPFLPYEEYRRILGRCHIALLPLEPGEFNECKSDIKFLECAAEGVGAFMPTWLMAAGKGHRISPSYCNHEKGFEDALRNWITNTAGRLATARAGYKYVRDYRLLGQHYRKRHEWYLDLMSKRAHLHQQLLDRCPELRHQESQSQPAQPTTLS